MVLADGRGIWASPGHPTADGRTLGELRAGDSLNHSTVILTQQADYDQAVTYDLLPSGDTGHYWANGILLGSTLFIP